MPGETDVKSTTTLNDNCLRIHEKFPHDGLYVVLLLCSGLPLDGRVRLEMWYAPHKCGNRNLDGFCDKRENCKRQNPLLEPLAGTPFCARTLCWNPCRNPF